MPWSNCVPTVFVSAVTTAQRLTDEELEERLGEEIERARTLLHRAAHPPALPRHADKTGGADEV